MTDEKAWDLSPLVESTEPAKVKEMLDEAVTKAKNFEAKYRGKITTLDAKGVVELYKEIERENLRREGVFLYGPLNYATNMTDPVAKDLNDYTDNIAMQISKLLAFIDLELGQLLKNNPNLIEDPILSEYKHALEKLNRRIPYQLTEIEEQLIIEKDRFGINAWSQLQSEWVSTRTFEIEIDGEIQTLPYGKYF